MNQPLLCHSRNSSFRKRNQNVPINLYLELFRIQCDEVLKGSQVGTYKSEYIEN